MYLGNVFVILSEVVNECGLIKKIKYKYYCYILIFEFKGVCVYVIYMKFYRRMYLVYIIICIIYLVILKL